MFVCHAFVQLIVIVQLLNSTRSSAIADKVPNASCQNYIHSTLVNSNHIQIERHVAIAIGPNAELYFSYHQDSSTV